MGEMTTRPTPRFALLAALLTGLAVLLPATASARIVELGQTTSPVVAPACPKNVSLKNCDIVLTRTTAVETLSDGVIEPTRVNQQGWVVAFSVGLSRLVSSKTARASIVKGLDSRFGGGPEIALTVLKPGGDNTYTVAAESRPFPLTSFLGQVLQEPLAQPPSFSAFTALPVFRGDIIGITIPTWAPVLSLDLPANQFSYRQSRRANCNHTAAGQTAQTRVGGSAQYGCYYANTRVQYTATEIVDAKVPRNEIGSGVRR